MIDTFLYFPGLTSSMDELPISFVSEWVSNAIEQVSKVLGLSFEGLDHMS